MRAIVPDLSNCPGAWAYGAAGGSGAAGESTAGCPSNLPSSSGAYNAAGASAAGHCSGFEQLKLHGQGGRVAPAAPIPYVQIPAVQFKQHLAQGFQQNAAQWTPGFHAPNHAQYQGQHPSPVQPPPPYESHYQPGQSQGAKPHPAAGAPAQQTEAEAIQARMRYLAEKMSVYTDCWDSPIRPRFF